MGLLATDTRRAGFTTAALIAIVVLVAALAWEAVTAARAQRETVEAVLRDYADIAAQQYAGSVASTLDYDWFYPVLRAAALVDDRLVVEPPQAEIRTQSGASHRLDSLATRFFGARLPHGPLEGAPGWPEPLQDAGVQALIEQQVPRAVQQGWPSALFAHEASADGRLIVYQARPSGQEILLFGFDAPMAALGRVLEAALASYGSLPAALTGEQGELVAMRVTTATGRVLYQAGPEFDPEFSATASLGERFDGLQVAAAIPPGSAAELVIGGLPRSRLPAILAMLAAAIVLLGLGVLLLRRERELVRLRERFVAGASHELRTPLAQLRMFAETLRLDRVRSEDERARSLEIIDREARRLSYLVENLLHFSRPPRPGVGVSRERIDLGALADEVLEGFAPLAAARESRLELVQGDAAEAFIDRDALRQVLLNMLDNATKYGSPGQTVTVRVGTSDDGRASLSVEDQGPGVAPADREHVWTRFWRGDETGGTTGTGIGLALVKELVESNAGEVHVEDAPGGGAAFVVLIPGAV